MQHQDTTHIHQSLLQSPPQHHIYQQQRVRSVSNNTPFYSSKAISASGGIRKKAPTPLASSRNRAVSTSYAERLHQIALEQQQSVDVDYNTFQSQQQQSNNINWLTPQQSPEPSCFFPEPVQLVGQFQWAAPTPPRSDSGIPSLSADVAEESLTQHQPTCTEGSSPAAFAFEQATAAADMSSLGFLLPNQYASGTYSSETGTSTAPTASSYPVDNTYPARSQAPASTAPQYGQSISSPALYQSRIAPASQRRLSDLPATGYTTSYDQSRRLATPYDSPAQSEYSMPQSQGMPMGSSPVPSYAAAYRQSHEAAPRYDPQQQYYGSAYSAAPAGAYVPATSAAYPQGYPAGNTDPSRSGNGAIRSMSSKPKPQCWDHGCNGREFSTFSNLLRHQREKSGTATKSYCPRCGAEFTRTTARNGHLAHDKCTKGRRLSEDQN